MFDPTFLETLNQTSLPEFMNLRGRNILLGLGLLSLSSLLQTNFHDHALAQPDSNHEIPMATPQPNLDRRMTLFHIEGKVLILKNGVKDWAQATQGSVIEEGDQLLTDASASADLVLDPYYLNLVHLGPNTRAELRSIEPTNLVLSDGSVFSSLQGLQPGEIYRVSTPSTIAGVRGTEFWSEYQSQTEQGTFSVVPSADGHPSSLDLWQMENGQPKNQLVLNAGLAYSFGKLSPEKSAKPFQKIPSHQIEQRKIIFEAYSKEVQGFDEMRKTGLYVRSQNPELMSGPLIQAPPPDVLTSQPLPPSKKKSNMKSAIMKGIAEGLVDEAGVPGLGQLTDLATKDRDDSDDSSDS